MANIDPHADLDPLQRDYKARGDRGTAVLREDAIEVAAGNLVPVESISQILIDLAGSCNGMLQSIPDQIRSLGIAEDAISRVVEIVQDVQLQISIALDSAVSAAVESVDQMEVEIEARDTLNADTVRGPVERKADRQHKGKPHIGNMKPKRVRAQ